MSTPTDEHHLLESVTRLAAENRAIRVRQRALVLAMGVWCAVEIGMHVSIAGATPPSFTTATAGPVAHSASNSRLGVSDTAVLRVRGLIVVDANGTERVWIGAPLPEPRLLGKRSKRGDPVSGILIFDGEGNERGGYVTGDNTGGASLTLDEAGRAAIHMSAGVRGDIHLALSDAHQQSLQLGINPNGPYVSLASRGKVQFLAPAPPSDSAKREK